MIDCDCASCLSRLQRFWADYLSNPRDRRRTLTATAGALMVWCLVGMVGGLLAWWGTP